MGRSSWFHRALLLFGMAQMLAAVPMTAAASPWPAPIYENLKMEQFSDVQLAPDGSAVAYSVSRGQLWLAPTKSGPAIDLDDHGVLDGPLWSPDSLSLVVACRPEYLPLSTELAHLGSQICAYDVRTRKMKVVSKLPHVQSLAYGWSPDGRKLAVEIINRRSSHAGVRAAGPNGVWNEGRWVLAEGGMNDYAYPTLPSDFDTEIDTIDVRSGQTEKIATEVGKAGHGTPVWSADGTQITDAFGDLSAPSSRESMQLISVDARTGRVRFTSISGCDHPAYAPSGHSLAYVCDRDGNGGPDFRDLFVDGNDVSRRLDLSAGSNVESDGPHWLDSRTVVVPFSSGGSIRLYRIGLHPFHAVAVTPSDAAVSECSIAPRAHLIAYVLSSADRPPEVYVSELDGAGARRRISHANDVPLSASMARADTIRWRAADGHTLQGELLLPPHAGPETPLLVELHAGPVGAWYDEFDPDAQFLASLGYAVFKPNPRGSAGYGIWSFQSLAGDWAASPAADVEDGVSAVRARGIGGKARAFVMGNGYGAYLAAWLVTHSHLFSAMVGGYGFYDLSMYAALSDQAKDLTARFNAGKFDITAPALARQSPMSFVSDDSAPVLLIAGGVETRAPYALSLAFYKALVDEGKEARLRLYEYGMDAPDWQQHRIDKMSLTIAWFGRHGGIRYDGKLR